MDEVVRIHGIVVVVLVSGVSPPGAASGLVSVAAGHDDMPVVLDGVIRPAREETGNDSPFVAVHAVRR